jgi:hypothetical protein
MINRHYSLFTQYIEGKEPTHPTLLLKDMDTFKQTMN